MSDTGRPRIGVIGLGAMGARIATRLVWERFNPQVYDVVDVSVRMFTNDVGGMMSGSPKMMAQTCDVILTVLPSADALQDVLYGWEGLVGGFAPGGVVIDMGGSDPLITAELGKRLAERGSPCVRVVACRPLRSIVALHVAGAQDAQGAFGRVGEADHQPVAQDPVATRPSRLAGQ